MSKKLINLTMNLVVQEIENALENYPHYPYQEAFAHPDLRQSLIAYILNRVPNHYITVDEEETQYNISDCLHHCVEQSLHIETLIHQGIGQILCEQAEEINRHIPEVVDPARLPSIWFG